MPARAPIEPCPRRGSGSPCEAANIRHQEKDGFAYRAPCAPEHAASSNAAVLDLDEKGSLPSPRTRS